MGAREALKVLQGQFEHAAKEFPGMMHIMAQRAKDGMYPIIPGAWKGSPPQQRSKDGMYPIVPDGLASARYCFRAWDKNLHREPDERGYPAWHWLRAPFFQQWDMQVVTDRFDILAKETGEIVAALDDSVLPISKAKLWVRRPAEYWVLLLHHFKLKPHWTIVNHDGTCTSKVWIRGRRVTRTHKVLLGGETETRLAKEGESHIYWLDDVFLSSALALGELLSKMPQPPTGGKAQDGAAASDKAAQNLVFHGPVEKVIVQQPEKDRNTVIENSPKTDAPQSAWVNGSFYLFAFLLIVVFLAALVKWVPWYALPGVTIVAILIMVLIGVLELRRDNLLSEKGFLEVVRMVFAKLPLIERFFRKKRV